MVEGLHYNKNDGRLEYDVYDKQQEVLEEFISGDNDVTEFRAGNRAGKTWLGARALIYLAFMHSGLEFVAIARSRTQGRKGTWKAIYENLPGCEPEPKKIENSPIVESFNETKKKIKINSRGDGTGSIIWLSSAEQGDDALVGSKINGVWCDESDYYPNPYELFDEASIRNATKPNYGILSTSTPNPNQNKINSDYFSIVEQRQHPDTGKPLNWNIKTVTASLFDNPFLSDEVKEEMRRKHQHNKETVLHGGFSDGGDNLVYEQFNRNQHVVNNLSELEFREGVNLYSYDAGYRHARVVLHFKLTVNNQYVLVHEFYERESLLDDAVNWLRDKPSGILYTEHAPSDYQKMRKELNHISIRKADKSINQGIDSVRSRLRVDDNNMVGLLFHEDCGNTISEIRTYAMDNIGSAEGGDDAMDCVRYVVHSNAGRFRVTNGDDADSIGRGIGVRDSDYNKR